MFSAIDYALLEDPWKRLRMSGLTCGWATWLHCWTVSLWGLHI